MPSRGRRRTAVLFALPREMAPLAARLGNVRAGDAGIYVPHCRGFLGNSDVLLVAGGMGWSLGAQASLAILQGWKPDVLVIAGAAGALAPHLQVGDLVVADRVVTEYATGRPTLPLPGRGAAVGGLFCVDRVLCTLDEKREARERTGCLAVEMETATAAAFAVIMNVPWGAVRAVSDTAGEALPLDFNRLRHEDEGLSPWKVARAVATHPSAVPALLRLRRNAAAAAERLAEYLAVWLKEPPAPQSRRTRRR